MFSSQRCRFHRCSVSLLLLYFAGCIYHQLNVSVNMVCKIYTHILRVCMLNTSTIGDRMPVIVFFYFASLCHETHLYLSYSGRTVLSKTLQIRSKSRPQVTYVFKCICKTKKQEVCVCVKISFYICRPCR